MNEWFKKVLDQIKNLWGKWSLVQKITLIGVGVGAILAIVLLINFSSAPSRIALLGVPVKDPTAFQSITSRLDQENISYTTSEDNKVFVADQKTAQRARAILVRENLVPKGTDPWALFDIERWTITDFERDINKRRAITKAVEQHIASLEDIDSVSVQLVMPEDKLFAEDQKPVTASVKITAKPGSDFNTNRKKIEGVVKLIQFAVEGLRPENIVITDAAGVTLNDFAGMADLDRLGLGIREMKQKKEMEAGYRSTIYQSLSGIFRPDRVNVLNVDLGLNTDKASIDKEEHTPIIKVKDNPLTPFSEEQVVDSFVLSETNRDVNFQGTGFNPEGPPGQEGQTPPAYKDLEGMVGKYSDKSNTTNHVVNTEKSKIEKSPIQITRITIGVALDGIWEKEYDNNGDVVVEQNGKIKRKYVPLTADQIQKAKGVIQAAVGYKAERGDVVTVEHIPFDRSAQFDKEDAEYRAQLQLQRTILIIIIGMAVVLIAFIAFRLISREMERRRRLREEELSRQHQAMREAALRSAEEEGVDVEMSVAERARLELQETAINMAREHPADVAQLIRTWLAEE